MLSVPVWADEYVGIPFLRYGRTREGCDCYGLVRLVLQEQFFITIPEYGEENYDDRAGQEEALCTHLHEFTPVPMDNRQPGDLLLLAVGGRPIHVGIVVSEEAMLHSFDGADSVVESYLGRIWGKRIYGCYNF